MGQTGASGAASDERPSIQDDEVRSPAPGDADAAAPAVTPPPAPARRAGRQRLIGAGLAAVVVAAGITWYAVGHGSGTSTSKGGVKAIEITTSSCGTGWKPASNVSQQSFTIQNKSGHAGEIYLLDAQGGIIGEIEGLGPGVERTMSVPLPNGSYKWLCVMSDQPVVASALAQVSGSSAPAAQALAPVSDKDLEGPVAAYQAYVAPKLATLLGQVNDLRSALNAGNTGAAKTAWLSAQLTWEQVGAAYGSFEDLGDAIDGLPSGLPKGVDDPDFTGLHRVEYGLYHGESASTLMPVVVKLQSDVTELRGKLPQLTIDPNDLSLRAHEILEDALRDHLTGATDLGAGAAFAETYADLQGTQVVFDELTALINARRPDLIPQAKAQMATLSQVLLANRHGANWTTLSEASRYDRQQVNAATSALLETLSSVPDLLEIRSAAQTK